MSARVRMTVIAAVATLLSSLSLSAAFRDASWFWPVVACITVAAAGCAVGRRVGLPRPLVPVVGLAGLAVLVTWLYARDVAVLGVLPGPGAWRALDQLMADGFEGIRRYSAPAPADTGLILLAAGGAGLVAVIVDTLAVTYRSAALAGAPLLGLYAVPVAVVRDGVPWLLFVVGALGWLGLMLAEGRDRISHWGRALDTRNSGGDNMLVRAPAEPLGVVGRRIAVTAVGLALLLPALLPWAGVDLFGGGGGGIGGSGGSNGSGTETINPYLQLGSSLQEKADTTLLTYTSNDPSPDYLRMVTLDTYDAKNGIWKPAKTSRDSGVPAEQVTPGDTDALPGHNVTTRLAAGPTFAQAWLPVLSPTTGITDLGGNWLYDDVTREVFAYGGTTARNAQYTVLSRHLDVSAADLRNADQLAPDSPLRLTNVALPADIPDSVKKLADQITRNAVTDYDKALALQEYFLNKANGFRYSTDVSAGAGDPLVSFLTQKVGFCQQYAGTFAVMARLEGLPTRVDVGFTPGTQNSNQPDEYTVSNHNAHAWPEIYFSGFGWVRFEPTVGGPSTIAPPSYAVPVLGGNGANNGTDTTDAPTVVTRSEANARRDQVDTGNALAQTTQSTTGTSGSPFPWKRLLIITVVLLLLVPGSVRLERRRRRLRHGRDLDGTGAEARDLVTSAWSEVADTARDLRLPWSPARTPRRTAAWLERSGVVDDAAQAAGRLAGAVERVNYAPAGVDVLRGGDPATDARTVVAAMAAGADRKSRWRARLMPASVLAAGSERTTEVLEAVDRTGARVRDSAERVLARRGSDSGPDGD